MTIGLNYWGIVKEKLSFLLTQLVHEKHTKNHAQDPSVSLGCLDLEEDTSSILSAQHIYDVCDV